MRQLKGARGNPARKVIEGLDKMLGPSGMLSYLSFMAERLVEMERLLKKTGSIYLHCDPNASHYLKAVMDAIFGAENFRNEIVWCYSNSGRPKNYFAKKHDIILLYTASEKGFWNNYRIPVSEKYLKSHYRQTDAQGRRCRIRVDAGKERTYYPDEGMTCNDWWNDIASLNSQASERLRYPTQKPIALLERIIKASSNKDDLVLDPFAGCGTTIVAAHNLGRRWAGIDISTLAVGIVKDIRLKPLGVGVNIKGDPADFASAKKLAKDKPFEFERWAIQRIEGMIPNDKQVGDGGIDGEGETDIDPPGLVLAQVKTKYEAKSLREFVGVVGGMENAQFGIYITLDKVSNPNADAKAADLGKLTVGARKYKRVQLWSIEEYFDDRKPDLPALKDPHTGRSMRRSIRMSGL